ncbi:hypothetical protein EJB05_55323, partial [Eragrostis curvula]
ERPLYPEAEVLVEYAMSIHRSLHSTDNVPDDMARRRENVHAQLKVFEAAVAPSSPSYGTRSSCRNSRRTGISTFTCSSRDSRNRIIDMFFQDRYLNAIQTNEHHI